MTNGDVKSVQGDTGHAEAEMVTDVYSEIITKIDVTMLKRWTNNFIPL